MSMHLDQRNSEFRSRGKEANDMHNTGNKTSIPTEEKESLLISTDLVTFLSPPWDVNRSNTDGYY